MQRTKGNSAGLLTFPACASAIEVEGTLERTHSWYMRGLSSQAVCSLQAWQSKFQAAAVDVDKLTGDLKRAQVRKDTLNPLPSWYVGTIQRGKIEFGYQSDSTKGGEGVSDPGCCLHLRNQTLQAEIARLKEREALAAAEDAE